MEPQQSTNKPSLFYCVARRQTLAGTLRAVSIAGQLTGWFRVLMLNAAAGAAAAREGLEFLDAPPISVDFEDSASASAASRRPESADESFQSVLLAHYERLRPSVLVVDEHPFGAAFDEDMADFLAIVRSDPQRPLVVCSLNDMVRADARYWSTHTDRTADHLNRFFDIVLVHSDPWFAHLEEHFRPVMPLRVPIRHTGFVQHLSGNPAGARERSVLIRVEDENHVAPLFRATVEAHRPLWDAFGVRTIFKVHADLSDADWHRLLDLARACPALSLERSGTGTGAEMSRSAWMVAELSHHAVCEMVAARVPALLISGEWTSWAHELERARRLERSGACRLMVPHRINGASLLSGIHHLLQFTPARLDLDFSGARASAEIIRDVFASRSATPSDRVSVSPSQDDAQRLG